MNPWLLMAIELIAAFCGAVLAHARDKENYEDALERKNIEVAGWKNKYVVLQAKMDGPLGSWLTMLGVFTPETEDIGKLLQSDDEVTTYASGQDPRD